MSTLTTLHTPPLAGLTPQQRADRAAELRHVATALRERANVLYVGCQGSAALTIHEFTTTAALLQ